MAIKQARSVMLVDDNPAQYKLLQKAFEKLNLPNEIIHFESGVKAIHFFEKKIKQKNYNKLPQILLLDLSMPMVDGIEILTWIKSQEYIKRIPIIIFSNITDGEHVGACYDIGISAYIEKPKEFNEMLKCVDSIAQFWFKINLNPI